MKCCLSWVRWTNPLWFLITCIWWVALLGALAELKAQWERPDGSLGCGDLHLVSSSACVAKAVWRGRLDEGAVSFNFKQKQRKMCVLCNVLPLDGTPGKTRRCHLEQRLAWDEHICACYAGVTSSFFFLERVRGSADVWGQILLF